MRAVNRGAAEVEDVPDIRSRAGFDYVVRTGDVHPSGELTIAARVEQVCQVDDGVDVVIGEEVEKRVTDVVLNEGDTVGVVVVYGANVRRKNELDIFGRLETTNQPGADVTGRPGDGDSKRRVSHPPRCP